MLDRQRPEQSNKKKNFRRIFLRTTTTLLIVRSLLRLPRRVMSFGPSLPSIHEHRCQKHTRPVRGGGAAPPPFGPPLGLASVSSRRTAPTASAIALSVGISSLVASAANPASASLSVGTVCPSAGTFLVRIAFLRALSLVHATAFAVALHQNSGLIGDTGICPARRVLDAAQQRGREKTERRLQWRRQGSDRGVTVSTGGESRFRLLGQRIRRRLGRVVDSSPRLVRLREVLWDRSDSMDRPVTTLLWLAKDRTRLNPWLDGIALTGLAASLVVLSLGAANIPLVLTLWACQRSLMAVGGPFYGFGWEPQLAELGFHALFLVPFLSLDPIPSGLPIPPPVRWAVQWHLFRVMMGAGLIKLRSGDRKWKDLTAMSYFYETQPSPNPVSRYFHWMPSRWHKCEVVVNHMVELAAPWLLIVPGLPLGWRRAGGLVQILFQAVLISSGNLSFLNWMTIVPAIICLDDAMLGRFFSSRTRLQAQLAAWVASNSPALGLSTARRIVCYAFLALIWYLSIPVIKNLASSRQIMNGSFDKLRLVNTYGAFGTVNTDRDEFIISAAASVDGPWKEYSFKVKPGDPRRAPRWTSPYHYRLDWQMWIAASCRLVDRSPWLYRFMIKLLERERRVLSLMGEDPWAEEARAGDASLLPKYIRIDLYRYKFHKPRPGEKDPLYWDREFHARVYPRRGQGVSTIESLNDDIRRRS